MRLYVIARFEREGSQVPLDDFDISTRVATTPEGAVRQMLAMAGRADLPAEHLRDDPQGLSFELSKRNVHYDVSEHDLDAGDAVATADAIPAHLSDAEMAELDEWRKSGRISARSRSLLKRFLDAPLPHQLATPEQQDELWRSLGLGDPPPGAGKRARQGRTGS